MPTHQVELPPVRLSERLLSLVEVGDVVDDPFYTPDRTFCIGEEMTAHRHVPQHPVFHLEYQ